MNPTPIDNILFEPEALEEKLKRVPDVSFYFNSPNIDGEIYSD
jgi:hypothetical protein